MFRSKWFLGPVATLPLWLAACGGSDGVPPRAPGQPEAFVDETAGTQAATPAPSTAVATVSPSAAATPKPASPSATTTASATAQPTKNATAQPTKGAGVPIDTGLRARFAQTANELRQAKNGRVEYVFKSSMEGNEASPFDEEFEGRWFAAASGSQRNLTVRFSGGGSELVMAFITNRDGSYACFSMTEGGKSTGFFTEEAGCVKGDDAPADEDDVFEFFDMSGLLEEAAAEGATITPLPGRTIAGVAGDCFRVEDLDEADGVICIGQQKPILLLIEADSVDGTFSVQLVNYADAARPGDFDLPFEIIKPEDFGGGGTGGTLGG